MAIDRRHFLQSAITSATAVPFIDSAGAAAAEADIRLACTTAGGGLSERRMATVASAGFAWIEASDDDVWDYRGRPDELKQLLKPYGLGIATVVVRGDFVDASKRLTNIGRAVGIARLLEELKASVLVLKNTGGTLAKPSDFLRLAGHLSEVGALVFEETGLRCAYDFDEADGAAIRKIIAVSDSRYVKFCLDARGLGSPGLDPARMTRAYGERVAHVRMSEGAQGLGGVAALAAELKGFGYGGWITVNARGDVTHESRKEFEEAVTGATPTKPIEHSESVRGRTQPVASIPVRDPYFKPLFFSADAFRDLSALVEAVIPETDTPGALAAGADEYADLMVWLDEDNHDRSRKQTDAFRGLCARRYERAFADLDGSQTAAFLGRLTAEDRSAEEREAGAFFALVRGLALRAYYSSPAGLLEELGYQGNDYLREFEGCTHPEHGA